MVEKFRVKVECLQNGAVIVHSGVQMMVQD